MSGRNGDAMTAGAVGQWMVKLRTALFEAVTEDDIREIAEGLVKRAKEGDLQATRMLFSYVLGGSSVNVKQALIVQQHGGTLEPLPAPPTKALPGTGEKFDVLAKRAANGQVLFHPKDGTHGG